MEPDKDKPVEETGQTNPYANVVGITGKPYVPDREELQPTDIDEEAIEMLEEVLEGFRSGLYHGAVVTVGRFSDTGRLDRLTDFVSQFAADNAMPFIGAVSLTKRRLMDLMESPVTIITDDDDPLGA